MDRLLIMVWEMDWVLVCGPVGNGYGPAFDYGLGDGPVLVLWIDNIDDACGVLQQFKDWQENERYLKVWHNVGLDRHILWNEGINVQGFGGDTMHMARLQNTSRTQFPLEALTTVLLGNDTEVTEQQQSIENGSKSSSTTEMTTTAAASSKTTAAAVVDHRNKSMKEPFCVPKKCQDGSDSKVTVVTSVEVLQRDPTHQTNWIQYSAKDAKLTWHLCLLSLCFLLLLQQLLLLLLFAGFLVLGIWVRFEPVNCLA